MRSPALPARGAPALCSPRRAGGGSPAPASARGERGAAFPRPPHKEPARGGDAGAGRAAEPGQRQPLSAASRRRAGPGGASPGLHPIPHHPTPSLPPCRAAGPGGRRCPTRPGELLSAGGSGHLVLRAGRGEWRAASSARVGPALPGAVPLPSSLFCPLGFGGARSGLGRKPNKGRHGDLVKASGSMRAGRSARDALLPGA